MSNFKKWNLLTGAKTIVFDPGLVSPGSFTVGRYEGLVQGSVVLGAVLVLLDPVPVLALGG